MMRALVVNPHQKSVRIAERPEPRAPLRDEVLLRILDVGICGTDREICSFQYGTPPAGAQEFILGHEALAEIVAVGPDVTLFRTGELVVPTVRRPCSSPRCAPCRAGRQDFCVTNQFSERGIVRADGYLTEFVLEEERYLIAVPTALRDVAVLVEPLSVVCKGAEEYQILRERFAFEVPHPRALVLGAGPIGLLAAMTFRADGSETHVFSREPEDAPRAALIAGFGGHYISSGRTAVDALPQRIGSVDVIFEAVGVPEVAWGALPTLGPNGIYVLTGVPSIGEPVPGDLRRWMRDIVLHNQIIVGIVNAGPSAYKQAVIRLERFLALFPQALRASIRRVPLDQALEVLQRGSGMKDVVSFA
jgi:glucose 1-dehydrogenase